MDLLGGPCTTRILEMIGVGCPPIALTKNLKNHRGGFRQSIPGDPEVLGILKIQVLEVSDDGGGSEPQPSQESRGRPAHRHDS